MIKLDRPTQAAAQVYATCISRIQDPELLTRLTGVTQIVVDASAEYDFAATRQLLHRIVQQAMIGEVVTRAEMEAVYTYRMAKKGAPGRDIYDALLTAAPQGKCPLCVHRVVSTLDHHLPKAHYPTLSVVPLNLVPACTDCNKAKLASHPANPSEEPLHPYFDDIDDERWLYAEVVEARPAAVRFFVNAPRRWGSTQTSRVQRHFRILGLGQLYATEAADELLNIRHQLSQLHATGGIALVRVELRDRAASCQLARRNGWRTAVFDAFAASDWFCDGGFSE